MSGESSTAPKERVNIRYKPATGDVKEEVELPHKLLMVGDFTQRADDTPLEERKRIDINKDNFNDVMRSQGLGLDLKVSNKLDETGENDTLGVHLDLRTLKDFEPEQVADQIPEIKKLLELREALTALKGPLGNMPSFRKAIEKIVSDETLRKQVAEEISGGGNTEG